MIEHLDRIENLGFVININWNRWLDVVYEVSSENQVSSGHFVSDIRVLSCSYAPFCGPSFEDIIETSCDFFYEWYNKNIEKIQDYEIDSTGSNFDKLMDSVVGDITKQVYRDFNLDNLLD